MNQHAKDEAPAFVLMAHYSDDTLDVVCHWHDEPSKDDLNEMTEDYLDGHSEPAEIVRFILVSGNVRQIDLPQTA